MDKNKFIKKLLIAGLCALTATATMGAVACKKNNDDKGGEDGGHEHAYSTQWSSDETKHWHDANCGHEVIADEANHVDGNEDGVCEVCDYGRVIPAETVTPAAIPAPNVIEKTGDGPALTEGNFEAEYEFDPAELSTTTYAEGWTDGVYTLPAGAAVKGRIKQGLYDGNTVVDSSYSSVNAVELNASGALSIKVSAAGTLVLYAQNGSSGVGSTDTPANQQLLIVKPDNSEQKIDYQAMGGGSTVQKITVQLEQEGTYTIKRGSNTTSWLMYAKFSNTVENTAIEKINIANAGKVDYLVGQQLDCTDIAVTATHAGSGRISPVASEHLSIDTSNYDATKPGTYSIGVTYTVASNLDSATKTFTESYDVNVYSYESLKIDTDKIVKEAQNSAAGNGVYANHSVQQFYFKGDTFSTDGLTVTAIGKNGETEKKFILDESQYTITASTAVVGEYVVRVAATAYDIKRTENIIIYVSEKASDLASLNEITLNVDAAYGAAEVGSKAADGSYKFKTIKQALDFIENSGVKNEATKTINLAAGTYWEKVEINTPNVTIIGAGESTTKIEYDALYGVEDASGFSHITDSTATLNVRDKAVNFTIKNVTLSNYYNTAASYTGAASNDNRALAVLIQSDKAIVENCTLLGYQDTLELFTGRQLFKNCTIVGTTDFIFGTNNTTYFYQCKIKSIKHIKGNSGYITAFKGLNKGAGIDDITYGAIFDDCDFTAETGVPVGETSIGRTWGSNATVMVMNSRLGGHISKTTSTNAGGRYISMSGAPKDAHFTEYNNTGDGAITESQTGVTVLDAAAAKNYNNIATIFGKTNGKVKYDDVWIPSSLEVETNTITVYTKEGEELGELVIVKGETLTEDDIKDIIAKSEYSAYDIVGVYSDSEGTEYTYPAISADGNVYVELHFEKAIVSSTTINFKQDANYADLLSGGKLEITPAEEGGSAYGEIKSDCIGFNENSTISFDVKAGTTIIVSAYGKKYTNYTIKIDGELKTDLTGAEEETGVLTGNVEFTVDNDCTVTLVNGSSESLAGRNYLYTVTVNVPKTYGHENIDLMQYDGGELSASTPGKWNGIEISGGTFKKRTENGDIQCAVGTTLTFKVEVDITKDDITVISYQNGPVAEGTWEITVENGIATIECKATTSNHQYIKAIQIA